MAATQDYTLRVTSEGCRTH